ncbi:MAG TPA: DJ-1/PfpI family protein [Thermoanaerobaculia bacterium]|nr:DJ-1/PfpI family protein [Thermoanaerobaculia bacterium]
MRLTLFAALLLTAAPLFAKLTPPADNRIRVAFVLTEGATMIDFAGPWEVFQDVMFDKDGRHVMPFELYTVSDTRAPIRTSGGMKVVPDYTFDDAPQPRVVVVGAQRGRSEKMLGWLRAQYGRADIVMSVCTGAFKLGLAGLLDGKRATTHHDFYDRFAKEVPKAELVKSTRFVKGDDKLYTAGGLTSGIDLALHVVELYYGRETAERTATYMEYESTSWKR